jgi:hypothetical protein
MKTTLLMLLFVTAASPVLADPHRANRGRARRHLRDRPGLCEPGGLGSRQGDRPRQRDDGGAGTPSKAVPGEPGLTGAASAFPQLRRTRLRAEQEKFRSS